MRKVINYIILLAILLCGASSFAQPGKIDLESDTQAEVDSLLNEADRMFYETGNYSQSAECYEKIFFLQNGKTDSEMFYSAAKCWARAGRKDKALDNINNALEAGFSEIARLKSDKDFLSLHQEQQWLVLMKKYGPLFTYKEISYFWGFYLGILFIFFFNNLFLFFSLKDVSFLYYCLLVIFHAQFEYYRSPEFGIFAAKLFIWSDSLAWIKHPFPFFLSLQVSFYILFVRKFLNLKENHPLFNKIANRLILLFLFIIILSELGYVIGRICNIFALLSYLLCFALGIAVWLKGYKQARFFVFASFVLSVGVLMLLPHEFGFGDLSFKVGVLRFDNVGYILFLILLSFALAEKINILKKEKEGALVKALDVLEEKVQERTAEVVQQKILIEEKNKDIMDSIRYAKRIQTSLLPTEKFIERILNKKNK